MSHELVKIDSLDIVQAYETFLAFNGDLERTALSLDVKLAGLEAIAVRDDWAGKLKRWNTLNGEGNQAAIQIKVNRAINYVQATRLRSILDKVISHIGQGDAQDLVNRLTVITKNGPEFKTRALTDLVKAAETAQLMTARALGDTQGERPDGADNSKSGSSIALEVMKALNAAEDVGLDSAAVVRKQLSDNT